ncbi:hypothetical protein [Echinicola rosea]|uniref:Uncharacterized protein n=1 Tax=Echinicola rosea TaxID=1807691 RepID=A0ABQ1V970_9BACT|nr:hypothetical protein [Echinicola rosea]GGF44264.1 hypothetical protein GCM10011339_35960 [Echinicola rosea]
MTEKRIIQLSISAIGILFIVGHLILPDIKIDGITVLLIIIVITPWLAPVFKSFELPGGLKVEFHDLEKATQKLEESGLIKKGSASKQHQVHSKYSFLNVVDIDSNLALSGLRMEIESRLKELAEQNFKVVDRHGINQIARQLSEHGVLSNQESSAILDILPILNKAAHGQDVDEQTHKWVIEIGPQILDSLEARKSAHELPDLISSYKNRDGAQGVEIGHELSKQLIKSIDTFFELMKKDKKAFNDWITELDTSTFTLYEASDEIEEELAYAKYSRLKEIMIEKVEQYLEKNTENNDAKELLNKLNDMNIRSIW